jgi:biofilm PGA synthesis N-glycosyltransferase PgaC
MLIFLAIVFGLYALLVIVFCWGWASLDERPAPAASSLRNISVVVAVRNEEASLPTLVKSLLQLNYPRQSAEFILVDDHSEDQSAAIMRELASRDDRFKVIPSAGYSVGKKQALASAIARATGDIVVVTDADCAVPEQWLASINAAFAEESVQMVVGPVRLTDRNGFEHTQAMEFVSLVGTTAATIALGKPTMCNAANLAFKRAAFYEVNGFEGNELVSSGDDQFLMKKFAARWAKGVRFMHDPQAVVTAQAASTLRDLIAQRLRWAGKWTGAFEVTSLLALAILCFHLSYLVLIGAWLSGSISTNAAIALASIRLFVEVIFLFPVSRFLNTRWRWSTFLLLQFCYPFYVIAIGFLSQILITRWKGREVTTGVWTGIS